MDRNNALDPSCIRQLPDTPIDIVGDVHGELDSLVGLLRKLGYDDRGRHAQHRKLVFVGDLVDRGPNSPGVLRAVMRLVESGNAQCIAGNHEINAIRDEPDKERSGEGWWHGRHEANYDSQLVDPHEKDRIFLPFLRKLPGALEREDLRVVHACWHEPAIEKLRHATTMIDAFEQEAEQNKSKLEPLGKVLRDTARAQNFAWRRVRDESQKPELFPELADYDEANQMGNAVKVVTSGIERPAKDSFWASGKWRMVERGPWWDEYSGPPVVVGHYWRRYFSDRPLNKEKIETDLFGDLPPESPLGPEGKVMCIDYSVGMRFAERTRNGSLGPGAREASRRTIQFDGCLAALRIPEWELVFDDERPRLAVAKPFAPSPT